MLGKSRSPVLAGSPWRLRAECWGAWTQGPIWEEGVSTVNLWVHKAGPGAPCRSSDPGAWGRESVC